MNDEQREKIEDDFVRAFNEKADQAHANAIAKGFWERDISDAEMIAQFHGEISEAWDAIRDGNPESDKIAGFSKVEEELADAMLRMLDSSKARGWRIAEALIAKMNYNAGRPYKHGRLF